MYQLKIKLKSLFKIKLLIVQLVSIFIALNMMLFITYNFTKSQKNIKELINTDVSIKLNAYFLKSGNDTVETYKSLYKDLKNSDLVDKIGAFFSYTTSLKDIIVDKPVKDMQCRKIYMDMSAIDLYNFNISKGASLTTNIINGDVEEIPILIGANFEKEFPLNSAFTIKELINGKMIDIKAKVIGILEKDSSFWSENDSDSSIKVSTLNNSIIIPLSEHLKIKEEQLNLQYMYGENTVISLKHSENREQIISQIEEKYISNESYMNFYNCKDILKETYAEYKFWLDILLIFIVSLSLLSLVGIVGEFLNYFKSNNIKNMKLNFLKKIIFIYALLDIVSIVILSVLSYFKCFNITFDLRIVPIVQSLGISMILVILAIVPIIFSLNTKKYNLKITSATHD